MKGAKCKVHTHTVVDNSDQWPFLGEFVVEFTTATTIFLTPDTEYSERFRGVRATDYYVLHTPEDG